MRNIIVLLSNLQLLLQLFRTDYMSSLAFAPPTTIESAFAQGRITTTTAYTPWTDGSIRTAFGANLNLSKMRFRNVRILYAETSTTSATTATTTSSAGEMTAPSAVDDDDEEEYEEIEYELLTEAEFVNAELLVGTNWDRSPDKIVETWVRLVVDKDGKNVAVWGDGAQGTWKLDVPSQFLSMSKENRFAGKDIWACTVNDYYYFQGTVRGWTYWRPAAVLGQWQARRLGVSKEEAGTPPWFENENESESS